MNLAVCIVWIQEMVIGEQLRAGVARFFTRIRGWEDGLCSPREEVVIRKEWNCPFVHD